MAELDDGIANLERFNALVTSTNTSLSSDTGTLESQAAAVTQLESEVQDELGGFDTDLGELEKELEQGQQEARDALEDLAQLGAAATDSRLEEAENQIEQKGTELEQALSTAEGELQQDVESLGREGFDAADGRVAALESEAEAQETETASALDALESSVGDTEQSVESAQGEAEGAVSSFTSVAGLDGAASALAALLADVQKAQADLQQAANTFESSLETSYGGLESELDGSSTGMIEEVDGVLTAAAQDLEANGSRAVEASVEEALSDSTQGLLTELAETERALNTGADVAEAAVPLIEELDVSQRVVAEVDRLLNAMDA